MLYLNSSSDPSDVHNAVCCVNLRPSKSRNEVAEARQQYTIYLYIYISIYVLYAYVPIYLYIYIYTVYYIEKRRINVGSGYLTLHSELYYHSGLAKCSWCSLYHGCCTQRSFSRSVLVGR